MQCRELQVVIRCDLPNFSCLSIRRRYPSLRLWAAKGALSNRLSARGILSISACGCLHMRLGMAKNAFVWKWWATHVTVDGNSAVPDGWRSTLNIEVRNNQKEKGLDVRIPQSQQVSIGPLGHFEADHPLFHYLRLDSACLFSWYYKLWAFHCPIIGTWPTAAFSVTNILSTLFDWMPS